MAPSPVRLAVVGSGNIAAVHSAAITLIPEARLVAICSRNLESARRLAAHSGSRVFGSTESLFDSGLAEAVLLATPSGVHAEGAISAFRAGCHVLCEKPLEIKRSRCANMIAEAEHRGLLLAGFFPLRCGEGARAIRQAVEGGRFGRLTFLSARVKWWRDTDYYRSSSWRGTWDGDGGGALMNQGIHAVDLLEWLGGPIATINAYAFVLGHPGIEVEDVLAAGLRFSSGALGTIEAGTCCYPGLDFSLEISGTEGTAILVNDRIEQWRFKEDRPEDDGFRPPTGGGIIGGGASDPKAISCEGHRQQIEAFCRAIRGERKDVIDGREAARAVAVVEAAYESARSGKSTPVCYL